MELEENQLKVKRKAGRPKGMKEIVKSVVVDLDKFELGHINFLLDKWDMKTKSKILLKCMEKIYLVENM